MSLADLAVHVLFGADQPPARYWIGLAKTTKELLDAGYDRQGVARGAWKLRGGTASTTVGFGPFEGAVEFDTTLLFAEQTLLQRIPIEAGPLRLTPGTFLDHAVHVTIGPCPPEADDVGA